MQPRVLLAVSQTLETHTQGLLQLLCYGEQSSPPGKEVPGLQREMHFPQSGQGLCHQPGEQGLLDQRSAAGEVLNVCHRRLQDSGPGSQGAGLLMRVQLLQPGHGEDGRDGAADRGPGSPHQRPPDPPGGDAAPVH
uniref:Uncharacterized protein n=2 Tax=Anguilla anguilla TaxID=7936 RepID=A0A0E9R5Q3_ANGAN